MQSETPLRLADFIRANIDSIVQEWVRFAETRTPASETMSHLALKNHIVELLDFIADDLESEQTEKERFAKSCGLEKRDDEFARTAAEVHALLRIKDGFRIDEVVSEFRALRASILNQWTNTRTGRPDEREDMIRFNEAIDQAIAESVAEYTMTANRSRDLFLGVLGHDLRNPIAAALMAARRIASLNVTDGKQKAMARQIALTMERATSILDDLLELTRTTFGSEIPLHRKQMNLAELGGQIVDEMRSLFDVRQIEISTLGETVGAWDRARMGQVLSNLIGNALQHSPADSSVTVKIVGEADQVFISVHNEGEPIPLDEQRTIFKPLSRGADCETRDTGAAHLGLGLFITHKIITAHGGTISVQSASGKGTRFIALVPKC
ncbi:sensor histidine kinase [Rhodopseudomonas pseudopalustris]|nr:sensor histidine kinase [Rhodopseudomonas pseudopalustris]